MNDALRRPRPGVVLTIVGLSLAAPLLYSALADSSEKPPNARQRLAYESLRQLNMGPLESRFANRRVTAVRSYSSLKDIEKHAWLAPSKPEDSFRTAKHLLKAGFVREAQAELETIAERAASRKQQNIHS